MAARIPLGLHGHDHGPGAGQPGWLKPWFGFWTSQQHPQAMFFAYLVAAVETPIAVALIAGFARKITYLSAIVFSLPIWATAEGFGGPCTSGASDIGTAIIYAVVFAGLLALSYYAGPARYSADHYLEQKISWWWRIAEMRHPAAATPAPPAANIPGSMPSRITPWQHAQPHRPPGRVLHRAGRLGDGPSRHARPALRPAPGGRASPVLSDWRASLRQAGRADCWPGGGQGDTPGRATAPTSRAGDDGFLCTQRSAILTGWTADRWASTPLAAVITPPGAVPPVRADLLGERAGDGGGLGLGDGAGLHKLAEHSLERGAGCQHPRFTDGPERGAVLPMSCRCGHDGQIDGRLDHLQPCGLGCRQGLQAGDQAAEPQHLIAQ
ncbi:MAG TPA: hypothetical protein DHU96_18105 [Actinobacteria bacterium]|nr:hypothetical protein [Actinomycetota bacterium]